MALRLVLALLVLAGCGTWVDVTFEAEPCSAERGAAVTFEVRDSDGTVVGTVDHDLASMGFPIAIRVRPLDGDASRTWAVEARLLTAEGIAISVRRVSGGYVPNERQTQTFTFEDGCLGLDCAAGLVCAGGTCVEPGDEASHPPVDVMACPAVVWVDGGSGTDGGNCESSATPCASIQPTVVRYAEPDRGLIVFVAGGATYTGGTGAVVELDRAAPGSRGAPRILRAWPGTGVPSIDAAGSSFGVQLASFGVVDGFEIANAIQSGVHLNGRDVHDNIVQRLDIHGSGAGDSDFDNRGAMQFNNGTANNLVLESTFRGGVTAIPGETVRGVMLNAATGIRFRRCSFVDNQGDGLDANDSDVEVVESLFARNGRHGVYASDGAIALRDVVACSNGGSGLAVVGSNELDLSHASVVDNDVDGVRLGTMVVSARVWDSVLVGNTGHGLRSEGATVDDGYNAYFENLAGSVSGFTRARPETDLDGVDPQTASACSPTLSPTSPARGRASDGGDMGSRYVP